MWGLDPEKTTKVDLRKFFSEFRVAECDIEFDGADGKATVILESEAEAKRAAK